MKYYCIGIKGTGMSTLAQILSDLGNEVSGYDDVLEDKFTQVGLNERDIPIYYDGNHDLDLDTIVTYSMAVSEDHPELQRVKKLGLKIRKYNEIIGSLTEMFDTIGVSGTHGKTTTSSLIKHILESNGGCNYFIGAGEGYATLDNNYFVVESDEFNKHFTAYHPTFSIITNIEKEHMECYQDLDDIRSAFEKFAQNTERVVIANGDNMETKKINYTSKVIFFGFGFNNDVIIKNLKLTPEGSRFDIFIKDDLYGSFEINLYGKHMVLDVCAAILLCREIGINKEDIIAGLKTFKNAKRRFAITNVLNTVIVDDYAHHPTEIRSTLEAIRQKYPDRRVVAVFKPNTYSRTRDFLDGFVEALGVADKAYVTPIDCNRERAEDYPGVCSELIVDRLENSELIDVDSIEKLLGEANSVVCFLSCAYVDKLIEAFKGVLLENSEGL